jgi:hypothetical protein
VNLCRAVCNTRPVTCVDATYTMILHLNDPFTCMASHVRVSTMSSTKISKATMHGTSIVIDTEAFNPRIWHAARVAGNHGPILVRQRVQFLLPDMTNLVQALHLLTGNDSTGIPEKCVGARYEACSWQHRGQQKNTTHSERGDQPQSTSQQPVTVPWKTAAQSLCGFHAPGSSLSMVALCFRPDLVQVA